MQIIDNLSPETINLLNYIFNSYFDNFKIKNNEKDEHFFSCNTDIS
jgi:hypothetical protein